MYIICKALVLQAYLKIITGLIGGVGINKVRDLLLVVPQLQQQKRIVEQLDKYIPICVK